MRLKKSLKAYVNSSISFSFRLLCTTKVFNNKSLTSLGINFLFPTLIEQLRSEIESLKQDKADLRSDLEAEKGTVTQLLASNYNLSNKLAELEAPKEDNESLDTTKDALNETKEELESLRKQLEETTNDLQKEHSKSWWAKLTGK